MSPPVESGGYALGAVCELTWASEIAPVRDAWAERAQDRSILLSQRVYAEGRAGALSGTYAARIADCGQVSDVMTCDGKLSRASTCKSYNRPRGCRQHLTCDVCRIARARRYNGKVRNGLEVQYARARAGARHLSWWTKKALRAWWRSTGYAPPHMLIVMMTISLRHTGDIRRDRRELAASWQRFRKAYHRRFGAFPFVNVYEITPGRDRLGHVHNHVVCVWPRGRPGDGGPGDWQLLRALWDDACRRQGRADFSASEKTEDAAGYVSKYVSKGVTTAGFDPILAAKVAAGTYNTRWVSSSRSFWLPFTPVCRVCKLKVRSGTFNFQRDATVDAWCSHGRGPPGIPWYGWDRVADYIADDSLPGHQATLPHVP